MKLMGRFADAGLEIWTETCLQAKKRRAEALDGIAGDIGDVCRARFLPTNVKVPQLYNYTLPQTHLGGYDHSLLNHSWLCKFEVTKASCPLHPFE